MRHPVIAQRGQALVIVLMFLAAFLLLVWAGSSLASGSFLSARAVQTDTRSTYALDAGIDFAIEYINLGTPCVAPSPPPLTVTYPTGTITVNVSIVVDSACKANKRLYDLTVTASGISRTLVAQIGQGQPGKGKPLTVNWESYQ